MNGNHCYFEFPAESTLIHVKIDCFTRNVKAMRLSHFYEDVVVWPT